ncbi:2Fe-2S iron-sulfur cluster-binding protein [Streptomyces sp. NPDC001595]|uniref:2Fe-2S iron-sulfur cluster-binding protein n=1 Tax=Streptomyces sp. NPDC001532 TaxID=3154520 RepID=UPI00332106B9
MTDDQHGEGTPQGAGRWDPLPQGDYDDGATAFVKLPEGGIDALLASSDSPLAAPGHGYVPPPITVTPATTAGTDPAATGSWAMPADGVRWPDPNAVPRQDTGHDRFTYDPGSTGQWAFEETAEAPPAPGHDVTGQWSIPVAGGDLPDESGEFTTSALVEQWGATPPATLPGGAAAPWATEGAGQAWGQQATAEDGTAAASTAPEIGVPAYRERPTAPASSPGQPAGEGAEGTVEAVEGAFEAAEAVAGTEGPGQVPTAAESHPEGLTDDSGEPHRPAVAGPVGEPAPQTDPTAAEAVPDAPGTTEATGTTGDTATTGDTEEPPPGPALPGEEHPLASYVLRVNGSDRPVTDAWIGESLLYVLRERLGLAGAKDGCSQGECGACNVQVDGRLVASCLVPAVTAAGSEVRTVEGLAVDGQPSDVQRALARCGAVQCGFCVPGMAMTVHDLLEGNPAPTELETRQALCGNLCRCSGYRAVVEAVQEVVAERDAHLAPDPAGHDTDEARIPHQAGPGAGGVNPSAFAPRDPSYGQGQDGGQA